MPSANGNILRVGVRWLFNASDEQVNIWWLRLETGSPVADIDLSAGITEYLETQYGLVLSRVSSNVQHFDTTIRNMTVGYDLTPMGRDPNLDGQDGTDMLPSDDAALIVWRTGVSRRLGRKYLPTLTKAQLSGGRWTTAAMGDFASFAALAEDTFDTVGGFGLTPGVRASVGSAFSTFLSHIVSNVPSHQDRRKLGVGS